MDINLIREALTIAAMAAFAGIVWWAYAPSRKARLQADGDSILEDEQP